MNAIKRLLFVTALAVPLIGAGVGQAAPGRNIAVLIGVDNYYYSVPDLHYCVKDVELMRSTLSEKCGYEKNEILAMHDKQEDGFKPRLRSIKIQVPKYLKTAGPDDTVLIFFSGHGFLDTDGRGLLAPADFDPSTDETKKQTGLPIAEVEQWLTDEKICRAKRKFLVLDCCHAGAKGGAPQPVGEELGDELDPNSFEIPENIQTAVDRSQGLLTLASCAANETSREWNYDKSTGQGQGLFTFYLAKGLSGEADTSDDSGDYDGIITHYELCDYVVRNVSRTALLELGAEQTPVLRRHADAKGLFVLAKVKGGRRFKGPLYRLDLAKSEAPKIPNDLFNKAKQQYLFLQSKSLDSPKRMEAAADLIEFAETLRYADEEADPDRRREIQTNPFHSPFFTPQWCDSSYDWMTAAEKEFQLQGRDAPVSLRVSLALAAWDKARPDAARAKQEIEALADLYPFDKSGVTRTAQARLLMMYAETRDDSPAGRRQALDCYVRIFDLVEQHESQVGRKINENVVNQGLIQPAQTLAEGLIETVGSKNAEQDETLRRQVARIYGEFGDLIRERRLFRQNEDALKAYQDAIRWDDSNPHYYVGLGSMELQELDPRYAEVRSWAFKALDYLDEDSSVSAAIAHRLAGDAWLRESRELEHFDDRLEMLKQSIDAYCKAIDSFGKATPNELGNLERRHFADSYLARSAAYLEQANFLTRIPKEREEILKKSVADAEQAASYDETFGYHAYMAMGQRPGGSRLAGRAEGRVRRRRSEVPTGRAVPAAAAQTAHLSRPLLLQVGRLRRPGQLPRTGPAQSGTQHHAGLDLRAAGSVLLARQDPS